MTPIDSAGAAPPSSARSASSLTSAPSGAARLRRIHRVSACVFGAFALLHLGHHLSGLLGIEVHMQATQLLRLVYRHPLLEPLLLAAVAAQWGSGLVLAWRRARAPRRGRPDWRGRLQAASGLVLALFLPIHLGAVMAGRAAGLDTHLHFAAAGLHVPATAAFFAVYYALAVWALCLHLANGLDRWLARGRWPWLLPWAAVAGALTGITLVLLLAGRIHAFTPPAAYLDNLMSSLK